MEICDLINESSDTARDAMKAIRKRLQQNAGKNNQVIMFTLTVLETCVKNCGKAFHVLVAQRDFIQELVKLIGPKNDPPMVVQEKVLSLIQTWADAFKNQPDLNGVTQMYMELKNKGIEFPQPDAENMAPIYTPQRVIWDLYVKDYKIYNMLLIFLECSWTATTSGFKSTCCCFTTTSYDDCCGFAGISFLTYFLFKVINYVIYCFNFKAAGPTQLSADQIAKLHSELEIVSMNMSILGEMLTELKPGMEEADDYQLLNDLTATCK